LRHDGAVAILLHAAVQGDGNHDFVSGEHGSASRLSMFGGDYAIHGTWGLSTPGWTARVVLLPEDNAASAAMRRCRQRGHDNECSERRTEAGDDPGLQPGIPVRRPDPHDTRSARPRDREQPATDARADGAGIFRE